MGGENAPLNLGVCVLSGSSPRGRGKRFLPRDNTPFFRLIPAWAGKTRPPPGPSRWGPGSSPRGRGKPAASLSVMRSFRLIPAWAGKTADASVRTIVLMAHPRVGGENGGLAFSVGEAPGSSPRGRGKRRPNRQTGLPLGLIPAWAGKTQVQSSPNPIPSAHPRVGGENTQIKLFTHNHEGSSPRGRGKPGIRQRRRATSWAHPRVGGENCARLAKRDLERGSSPRGRGKRLQTPCSQR